MVIKNWLQKLKRGIKGEVVRDYSAITKDTDGLDAKLKRESNSFSFAIFVKHREHGTAEFKAPVTKETMTVLEKLVADVKAVREKGDASKNLRLRFRDGEIDLVITYKYMDELPTPRQRTAPVNGRTVKLLEEMLSDADTLMANQFELYDLDES